MAWIILILLWTKKVITRKVWSDRQRSLPIKWSVPRLYLINLVAMFQVISPRCSSVWGPGFEASTTSKSWTWPPTTPCAKICPIFRSYLFMLPEVFCQSKFGIKKLNAINWGQGTFPKAKEIKRIKGSNTMVLLLSSTWWWWWYLMSYPMCRN